MERMAPWQIALRRLEMPVPRVLFAFVLPAALAGLVSAILLIWLTGGFSEGGLFAGFTGIFLIITLPLLTGAAAIYFPILEVNRSAIKIEKEMHMFITRMGILSLGEVGADTIFDILRQMKDYGELAQEVKRIETLVDKWHTSLPEAARIVAQQSPSPLWTDFLDRMAFSIEAGQPIDSFMRAEQETVAEQYNTIYDTRLESVDTLKEIYVSLVSAGLFGLVVAGIHLVLFEIGNGSSATPIELATRIRWLLLAGFLFVVIQVGALFAFRATIPDDQTFARDGFETPFRLLFRQTWLGAGLVSIALMIVTIVVVISYGQIIPKEFLDLSKNGFLNIHASILPKFRGAAPIQRAIMSQDIETGISFMKINEHLDAGPVLETYKIKIDLDLNATELQEKLSQLAALKIIENIDSILSGKANFKEQDHSEATYAEKINKAEGKIFWNDSAKKIIGKINGLHPNPGAYFIFKGDRYKILKAEIGNGTGPSGKVLNDNLEIACSNNESIKVIEIQKEGKKIQEINEFLNGSKMHKGCTLNE